MKTLLFLVFIVSSLRAQVFFPTIPISVPAGGGGGTTPDTVQTAGVTFDNAGAVKAFRVNVTAGNLLVVALPVWHHSPVVSELTKSAGTAAIGTIVQDTVYYFRDSKGNDFRVAIYSVPVRSSGSCTLTHTTEATCGGQMAIMEFSGLDTTTTRKQISAKGSGETGTPTTGTFNVTGVVAIIGGLATNTGVLTTHTVSTDYKTVYQEQNGASHTTGSTVYRVTSGSITGETTDWTAPTMDGTDVVSFTCAAVAYKKAP